MKAEELIREYRLARSALTASLANMDNLKAVMEKVVDSYYFEASRKRCQRDLNGAAERFAEYSEDLTEAIMGLGDSRYIDVLTFLVLEDHTTVRTAELMGYSVRNIHKLKAEAMAELDKLLEE